LYCILPQLFCKISTSFPPIILSFAFPIHHN
jgi:hypothetical protein